MKWIALAFVVLYVGAIVIGKLVTAAFDYFQVDGNHSAGACPLTKGGTRAESGIPPDVTLKLVGGPFAVDASNGPNWFDRDPKLPWPHTSGSFGDAPNVAPISDREALRLCGLVEVHKLPEGIVPPPSRSIRSSKVH